MILASRQKSILTTHLSLESPSYRSASALSEAERPNHQPTQVGQPREGTRQTVCCEPE
jgi:hypothetical protein